MTDDHSDQTTLHIGYGAGFAGDRPQAALALATRHGPRYLALELLAERTLAQCQQRRHDDETSGYALRLFDFLEPILPTCLASGIPVITNGGAANPVAAAHRLRPWLDDHGFHDTRIACVLGDDLVEQLSASSPPDWLPEDVVLDEVVSCNVYIGAERIQQALEEGADIVMCGRVADPSMAVGAVRHGLGWSAGDPELTAIALATGHLLECCTQITGGYFADPITNPVPDPAHPGCPIIELRSDGRLIVTKTTGTGGMVSARTVKEQLLYEIHDPAAYLTPDGVMDVSQAQVIEQGDDRVEVRGIQGLPAPATLKGNLALTLLVLTALFTGLFPLYLTFMIGLAVALVLNFPSLKDQADAIARHASDALSMALVMLAAGILLGVLAGTGMSDGMAYRLLDLLPASAVGSLHIIVGILGVPLQMIFSPDAYYFALMPIVRDVAQAGGVSVEAIARAMLIGENTGFSVSPVVPSVYLAIGLAGVDLRAHIRFSFLWAWGLSVVLLLFAMLIGAVAA